MGDMADDLYHQEIMQEIIRNDDSGWFNYKTPKRNNDMTLRATIPELEEQRFKLLLHGGPNSGKTHLCCEFPRPYYIDTEKLNSYQKYIKRIRANKGALIYLLEMNDILDEVRKLMTVDHDYKTLIIDSISFPYAYLAALEADRLIKAGGRTKEGTEFGANLAKSKRLSFYLGILLTRLDMNVIVTTHEKDEIKGDKTTGNIISDVTDKMTHALGSSARMVNTGGSRRLLMMKSRYEEISDNAIINVDSGYEAIKNIFGEEMFLKKSKSVEFASLEQIQEVKFLVGSQHIKQETVNKWLIKDNATCYEDMSSQYAERLINHLKNRVSGEDVKQ